jgi:hypothetical protein
VNAEDVVRKVLNKIEVPWYILFWICGSLANLRGDYRHQVNRFKKKLPEGEEQK